MMAVLCCDGDPKLFETGIGADLSIIGGQPVMDDGLENAVYLSLFTPPGWWGNILSTSESYRYESRIPELFRRTLTNQVRIDAEKYATDALAWMGIERIADKITPTAVILSVGVLGLAIKIDQPSRSLTLRYQLNWAAMEVRAT
jgi:phage gp46-like protein